MKEKGFVLPQLFIILILVVVLAYGAYNFLIKSSIQYNTQTNIQKSSAPALKAALNYTIPILKDYDPKSMGRNLWLYNEDMRQGKQITSNHEISQLFSLSPDKKNILVTTINNTQNDNNLHEKISTVDTNNGTIKRLFSSYNQYASVWKAAWLDNNRIVYALGKQLMIYDISSGSEEILVNSGKDINDGFVLNFDISPDKRRLVYYYSGGGEGAPVLQNLNTYSINLDTKKQLALLSESDHEYYLALNNNFVIYRKSVDNTNTTNQIWRTDFSVTQKEFITTLPQGELINILSNDSGNQLIYQLRFVPQNYAELYLYDLITKQIKTLFKADAADGIREPKISADGNSVLFNAALDKKDPIQFTLVNYNLQTNAQSLMENREQSPHTVIIY